MRAKRVERDRFVRLGLRANRDNIHLRVCHQRFMALVSTGHPMLLCNSCGNLRNEVGHCRHLAASPTDSRQMFMYRHPTKTDDANV